MSEPIQSPSIKKVLIIYNPAKTNTLETARQALAIFQHAGIPAIISEHRRTEDSEDICKRRIQSLAKDCDLILALGGDGTILGVARAIAESPIPLLGINLGGFGFLSAGDARELESIVEAFLANRHCVIERYMLEAIVKRPAPDGEQTVFRTVVLNEGLISLSRPGRLLDLTLEENGKPALAYRADGLIVATPTGSTGHSLSAGGPILQPHIAALIVTPLSPHSLFNRPLVFDGKRDLCVCFKERTKELVLILDGQIHFTMQSTDRVYFRRYDKTLPIISLPDHSFMQVLRHKFNLGELSGFDRADWDGDC